MEWNPPEVTRKELCRTAALTHISSICADPELRFLLLYRWETRDILIMDPDRGSCSVLFTPGDEPHLLDFRTIRVGHHGTDGYVYRLFKTPRWNDRPAHDSITTTLSNGDIVTATDTVVFLDSDMDGIIEPASLEYLDFPAQVARGYLQNESWIARPEPAR